MPEDADRAATVSAHVVKLPWLHAWRRQLVLVEWASTEAARVGCAHLEAGWRTRRAEIWSASLAPVRHACTLTFWPSTSDVARFASGKSTPHGLVQQRSDDHAWLAESLFARFSVVGHRGSWAGTDPLRREPDEE